MKLWQRVQHAKDKAATSGTQMSPVAQLTTAPYAVAVDRQKLGKLPKNRVETAWEMDIQTRERCTGAARTAKERVYVDK